jgi:hypothetical protein
MVVKYLLKKDLSISNNAKLRHSNRNPNTSARHFFYISSIWMLLSLEWLGRNPGRFNEFLDHSIDSDVN